MRMEKNESFIGFVAQFKDLKDILGDIEEKVSNFDLVTITLNGMTNEEHMFIIGLSAREKAHAFEELTRILILEEEWRQNLILQSVGLYLMVKQKPYKGKQPQGQKGSGGF